MDPLPPGRISGLGGQAHSRSAQEPQLLLLISVTRLHGFLEVVIGKAVCLLEE